MAKAPKTAPKDNLKAIDDGWMIVRAHSLFGSLRHMATFRIAGADQPFPKDGYVRILVGKGARIFGPRRLTTFDYNYTIVSNGYRRATPAEWANVHGQALLHIVLCHVDPHRSDPAWRMACELMAADFLRNLSIGERPSELAYLTTALPGRTLEVIARAIDRGGAEAIEMYGGQGIAGGRQPTWVWTGPVPNFDAATRAEHDQIFATAIRRNIIDAVEAAGRTARGPGNAIRNPNSKAERARAWFIASYPLLAALASAFDIVEDEQVCKQFDIRIAAVDAELRCIYINPTFAWNFETMKFVMAHELLHVGLSHSARRQGRDPYLWNVACDFVINGWLLEMGVGQLPTDNLLLDEELGFERYSAEAIYDLIVKDLRLCRRLGKVMTMRGVGKPDMLGDRPPGWWKGAGCDLDAFYRRALADGLDLHMNGPGRGLIPGDLIEEVRALQHPPIPWDVKLGQWMDAFFPPIERKRTFARASRRQSSTPDIPRPVYERPHDRLASRTFGVVVDTSGSMPLSLIARAFGAIASYAMSREVPLVRILQCDAGVHDMGFVEPERLLERIDVRGGGGTVLQPAIDRLMRADNFPKDAPILVITDGWCDALTIGREHAYLMPAGQRLPFRTPAPVFQFENG